MGKFIRSYWKTLLFFAIIGLVSGALAGLYALDGYPEEIVATLQAELESEGLGAIPLNIFIAAVSSWQGAFYGLVLGAIGIFLAKRVGLWRDERRIEKKPLIATIIVALVGGAGIILPDLLFFGKYSEAIMDSYSQKPNAVTVLATVTYGGVIEEIMMRLFFMSLVVFFLKLLFARKKEKPAPWMFIVANILSALLFAAGHLPATAVMLGITPLIVFRCFLLNGAFGLLFGWLYRKYGLRYAMIAHGGCHIVSKLIWILFV